MDKLATTPVQTAKQAVPRFPAPLNYSTLPDCALLRERQILPVLPFSSPTLWRRTRTGSFPQPIRLEGRMTAWRWGDVRDWLEAQEQQQVAA